MWDDLTRTLLSDRGTGILLGLALQQFYLFLLVLVRLSGLMLMGPFFGHMSIPPNVRVIVTLSITALVFPSLTATMHVSSIAIPATIFDLVWIVLGELLVGVFLGFGVMLILMGVQMAGDMFDQQAGTALGEIFNPMLNSSSAPTGQLMTMLATTLFLVMTPMEGHLSMLRIMLDSFESLPVGTVLNLTEAGSVLLVLFEQAVRLSLQLAALMLAAMSLVSMTMGFLGYTVPQINVLVMGFPIRAGLCLLILAMTASGMTEIMMDHMTRALETLRIVIGNS